MLRVAKERHPEVNFVEADLTNSIIGESQLCDRPFDVVTAFRFFPNAEASLRYEAIKAIGKRLKPGGILIANNHRNPHSLYRRLTISLGGPQCSLTDEAFVKIAQDVGLQIRSRTPIGFLPLRERVGQLFFDHLVKLETIFSRIVPSPLLAQNVIYEFEKK